MGGIGIEKQLENASENGEFRGRVLGGIESIKSTLKRIDGQIEKKADHDDFIEFKKTTNKRHDAHESRTLRIERVVLVGSGGIAVIFAILRILGVNI